MQKRVFIVDDEPKIGEVLVKVLRRKGFDAHAFISPVRLLEHLDKGDVPHVILTDLMMPEMNGIELLKALRERSMTIPVIVTTGKASISTAVEAMRLGAYHYLEKPLNLEQLQTLLQKAIERYEVSDTGSEEQTQAAGAEHVKSRILGDSEAIKHVRKTIQRLQDVPNTVVLIRGETGTGKNLVAQTIHDSSVYNAGRFVEINCASLPDNLLESELFGYEEGAFTGARTAKLGLLEIADGGTVFLDEIDSMSTALQAKLLSFLESRTFRRLGGTRDIRVTTRILSATNADLEEKVLEGKFREDLYFRVNVANIFMPPLRKVGEDLLIIAMAVINEFNTKLNRHVQGFTPDAKEKLLQYAWPGNVRELRNVLERAMIFIDHDYLTVDDLNFSNALQQRWGDQESVRLAVNSAVEENENVFKFSLVGSLKELEKAYLQHVFRTIEANYVEFAKLMGISKKTLWEKRKLYRLDEQQLQG